MSSPDGAAVSSAPEADGEVGVAIAAAEAAGEVLLRHMRAGVTARWKGDRDPVTDADEEAEAVVRDHLRAAFPADVIIGEEGPGVAESEVAGRRRWYVDPLDGTTNFLRGRRRWASSVALCDADGRMVAAAVRVPCWGETYAARLGGGAWCNGERLTGSAVTRVDEVLLAVGALEAGDGQRAALGRLSSQVLSVRVTGSTVCDLCDAAAGRVDAFWAGTAGRWDLAAGALIATEAGMVATDLAGAPVRGPAEAVLVAAPAMHGRLLELLADRP